MQLVRKYWLPVVFVAVLLISTVALAVSTHRQTVKNTEPTTQTSQEKKIKPKSKNQSTVLIDASQPCDKSTSTHTENSAAGQTNTNHTEISCQSTEAAGSTTISVSSNSSQTATSGSSTGQSGNASNSDHTTIRINR